MTKDKTLSHCRTGCHAERIATATEQVLPSLPPATVAQRATFSYLLHAVTAKVWHFSISSRMEQVCALHSRGWRRSGAAPVHCVFYAPRGATLSSTQVCIRVVSCQRQREKQKDMEKERQRGRHSKEKGSDSTKNHAQHDGSIKRNKKKIDISTLDH